jgi:hypothetical protein
MKRLKLLLPVALLLTIAASVALADHFSGWILDQKCAMAGLHEGDHTSHLSADNPAVFLNEADRRVYTLKDATRMETLLGKKVAVEGDLFRDTIIVKSLMEIPESPSKGQ